MLTGPLLITTTRIRWLDALESFYLDTELAEAGKRKGMSAVDKAAEWLADYLASEGGRADSADVRRDGKGAGHSVATLKRAMAEAGVTAENTNTTPRRTEWVLDDYQPGDSPGVQSAQTKLAQSAHARGESPDLSPLGDRGVCEPTTH